jgi:hypothetical protein
MNKRTSFEDEERAILYSLNAFFVSFFID